MSRTRCSTRAHLHVAGLPADAYSVWRSVCAQAQLLLETPFAWLRSLDAISASVVRVEGAEAFAEAIHAQVPIVLIVPHLGNYEIAGRYVSHHFKVPVTALFRPPKQAWLAPLMQQGRARGQGQVAPATASGVRLLLKALQRQEAVLVLPDQVPAQGESGVWVPWFGRLAYTMTLLPKLLRQQKNARCFTLCALRQGCGRFLLRLEPYHVPEDPAQDFLHLHATLEAMIRRAPEQYLWSYNRYKCPQGVTPAC